MKRNTQWFHLVVGEWTLAFHCNIDNSDDEILASFTRGNISVLKGFNLKTKMFGSEDGVGKFTPPKVSSEVCNLFARLVLEE